MNHEDFVEYVHEALRHIYEPDWLRRSPLATLFGVSGRPDTFAALQKILISAIESLQPAAAEPAQPGVWETYELLYSRYVQQLTQYQVARQLSISVRHLRRKEHAALEVLATRLWEQLGLTTQAVQAGPLEVMVEPALNIPSVQAELVWLQESLPESQAELRHIFSEVLSLAEPLAIRHNVSLEQDLWDTSENEIPPLAVQPLALSQALLSLLGVAIRRVPGGRVSISAETRLPVVEIVLRGAPLGAAPLKCQQDDEVNLELARQLTHLCGGRLVVEEHHEVFVATLTLPVVTPLRVLVVDDNADTLQLLRRYTSDTPYRLITTQDPEQCISLAEQFAPHIIVIDVMMPHVDGWKMLGRLRQHPATAHIPIIVCTILAQEELALLLGASGFLRKPVTRQAFLDELARQTRLGDKAPG